MKKRKKMTRLDKSGMGLSVFGCSTKNGIFIRFEKVKKSDNEIRVVAYPGALASIENAELVGYSNINIEDVDIKLNEQEAKKVVKLKSWFLRLTIISIILMLPTAFIHPYFATLMLALFFIFWGCAGIPVIIYEFFKRLKGDKEIIQKYKYHAAEHAVINAYYDLKRVPTLEEIKQYSSFSYHCSIPKEFKNIWTILGIGICRLLPGEWYFVALILFIVFSVWAYKNELYFTEIFTLSKPTDLEYQAAIRCLEIVVEEKNEIDKVIDFLM